MPQRMSMSTNIMSTSRGARSLPYNVLSGTSLPVANSRQRVLGGMGMIGRIRNLPSGCSSCGGR